MVRDVPHLNARSVAHASQIAVMHLEVSTFAAVGVLKDFGHVRRQKDGLMTSLEAYQQLIQRYRQARLLDSIGSLVGWDERTYMPPKGSAHRAEQMALLAKMTHEQLTAPALGELLDAVERAPQQAAPDSIEA